MEELKQLSQEKETIEAEILMLAEELTSPGLDGSPAPELKGPLIDKDGFPRADIDVYNTRIKRHRYNVLQTDHKMLMKRIEELLPQIYAAKRKEKDPSTSSTAAPPPPAAAAASEMTKVDKLVVPDNKDTAIDVTLYPPFAVIQSVHAGSPAAEAGLLKDDEILTFGTATAGNHRQLQALADVVKNHIGKEIRVLVRRSGNYVALTVTPHLWEGGPGVLGCHFMPF